MDNEKVKGAIKEAVDAKYIEQGAKDKLKAISDRMKEEQGIPTAKWNKMVKFAYDLSLGEKIAELEEIHSILTSIGVDA